MTDLDTVHEIEKLEKAVVDQILVQLEEELDWGDFLEVAELVLGNTQNVQLLRGMVNDYLGLDLKANTGEVNDA